LEKDGKENPKDYPNSNVRKKGNPTRKKPTQKKVSSNRQGNLAAFEKGSQESANRMQKSQRGEFPIPRGEKGAAKGEERTEGDPDRKEKPLSLRDSRRRWTRSLGIIPDGE